MQTFEQVIGIDEVGRGCWAGPLVAGAVLLHDEILGLKDSKKLSKKQRSVLALQIKTNARAIGLGWVTPQEVDSLGLTLGVKLAMERALLSLRQKLRSNDSQYSIIIDGNYNFLPKEPTARALVRADDKIPAVSAASIIAKVARDEFMVLAATKYPVYGFESHVGYGTITHQKALKSHGVCALHRRSFKPIKHIIEDGQHV